MPQAYPPTPPNGTCAAAIRSRTTPFPSSIFATTGVRYTGREGIDERLFRFGLRFQF